MCRGPPLSLCPFSGAEEFKGSALRREHMATYSRCEIQGPKECQGLPSSLAGNAKIPYGKCLQRGTDYRWRQASLYRGAEEQRQRAAAGAYLRTGGTARTAPAPDREEKESEEGPELTKAVPRLPTLTHALPSSFPLGFELLQTSHHKQG